MGKRARDGKKRSQIARRDQSRNRASKASTPAAARLLTGRRLAAVCIVAALAGVVALLSYRGRLLVSDRARSGESGQVSSARITATFVGATACAACHQREFQLWNGSHHQLAMQPATDTTVLGDFNDARLSGAGAGSRFFRRGGKFFARTAGPDGAPHDYRIAYTFGVAPLQQYLVAFPGGRLQALRGAWDNRPREQGGQRWFNLYPGQKISHTDPLYWTGPNQNWNYMCADCHSTNLRKNYDARTRTYATSYSEIDVACEACHGPGSNHVAWAQKKGNAWEAQAKTKGLLISLDERKNAGWVIDPSTGNARRGAPRMSTREIQMCARCHARRGQIHEDFVHGQAVGDDYRVALLDDNLYYPDGQIKDEDYEYGSFIQSRMFHAGVTCSDCHEPHSLKLRAAGNAVCFQCHAAGKYDSPQHHFHRPGSAGARCADCHMPATVYMAVDARRDHSIRIPRPDLSVKLGVPNACNKCHTGKSAQWAASAVIKWYGHVPVGFQRFAQALSAGSSGAPGGQKQLAELIADQTQPAIARASALARMGTFPGQMLLAAARRGVTDPDPLVRRAAARALADIDPRVSAAILSPLLTDSVRAVRIQAGEVLAGAPAGVLPGGAGTALGDAIDQYVAAQELNADRPEAHLNLAVLYVKEKQAGKAEAELKTALSLDPSFAPAAVNLADLYRELGRDAEGERILREALARSPSDASIEHALGLLLIRQGHRANALEHLAAAVRLDPANARFAYVWALALQDAGGTNEAIDVLETEIKSHPYDREALAALAGLYASAGNPRRGLDYAEHLAEIEPDNPQVQQLVAQLRAQAEGPGR